MANLKKAVEFVISHGNKEERSRLNYWLKDEPLPRNLIERIFANQQADGGWEPRWVEAYSSPNATCYRLAQAQQLGMSGSESSVKQAVMFLIQRQSLDGSWEEEPSAAEAAPPWAKPGELGAKLYLTANCGFWVAYWGNREGGGTKAASFLIRHLDEDGRLPSYLHAHWLAGGLWTLLGWRQPVESVTSYLSARLHDLAASNLSWLITTYLAAGTPPTHPLLEAAASLLAQQQQDGGHWQSEDGPEHDVSATLEALYALAGCGISNEP
jgi:hypothetical protein